MRRPYRSFNYRGAAVLDRHRARAAQGDEARRRLPRPGTRRPRNSTAATDCEEWKDDETSDDYDWRLIRSRLRQIRQYRAGGRRSRKLVHHLRQGLHWNLGNIGNPALYAPRPHRHQAADPASTSPRSPPRSTSSATSSVRASPDRASCKFFHEVALSYGRSALMLSGGATLGLFHVGVVKALFREGLVPSGHVRLVSAGSVVAATVGTRAPRRDRGTCSIPRPRTTTSGACCRCAR